MVRRSLQLAPNPFYKPTPILNLSGSTMKNILHNPNSLFPPYRGYAHAMEVPAGSRLLFISGLNGYEQDGKTMPESVLASAGMSTTDLVFLRTYLADPSLDEANALMREKQLGGHRVSSTVVCCQLLETKWKVEIEAVAAAGRS
jgi:2-iminobutanoate/2-iminopropanoate deaminase